MTIPDGSPPAVQIAPAEARAQHDAIIADRASGKINDYQWRTEYGAKALALGRQMGNAEPARQAPATVQPSAAPPLSAMHEIEINKLAAKYQALDPKLDAARARGLAELERRVMHGSPEERAVALAQINEGNTARAFQESIDAHMQPAKNPGEYRIPNSDRLSAEQEGAARELRNAMYSAGLSREVGNSLAEEVSKTARDLRKATSDADIESYMAEQDRALRSIWGSHYEQKLTIAREFLREAGERSPAVRALLEKHPQILAGWKSVEMLARVAESQARMRGRP